MSDQIENPPNMCQEKIHELFISQSGAQTKHIGMKRIGMKPIATKPIDIKGIGYKT